MDIFKNGLKTGEENINQEVGWKNINEIKIIPEKKQIIMN